MIELSLYFIHFAILIVCWYLISISTKPRLIPTIENYFFLFFTSFIYLGSIFIFIEKGCSNWVFIISIWAFSLLLSMSTALFYTGWQKIRNRAGVFVDMGVATPYPRVVVRLFAVILFFVSLIYFYKYISIVGFSKLPLYYILTSSDYDIGVVGKLREETTKFGYYSDYRWIFNYVMPLSFFLLFGLWKTQRDKLSLVFCFLVLPITMFSLTMTFQKSKIAQFFLMWAVISFYLSRRRTITRRSLIVVFLSIFIFLTFFVAVKNKAFELSYDQYVSRSLLPMIDRIFLGQTKPAYTYFEIFPHHYEYLGGVSFPNPKGILPYEPFKLTRMIYSINHPEKNNLGTSPSVFFSEFYANFGILGVTISCFFVIFCFLTFSTMFYNKSKNMPKIVFGTFIMQEASTLAITSLLSGFLFPIVLRIGFLFGLYFVFVRVCSSSEYDE